MNIGTERTQAHDNILRDREHRIRIIREMKGEGKSNAEIADFLGISESYVRTVLKEDL